MSWTTLDASSIKASRTVCINKGIKMSPRSGGGGQVLRNVEGGSSICPSLEDNVPRKHQTESQVVSKQSQARPRKCNG